MLARPRERPDECPVTAEFTSADALQPFFLIWLTRVRVLNTSPGGRPDRSNDGICSLGNLLANFLQIAHWCCYSGGVWLASA